MRRRVVAIYDMLLAHKIVEHKTPTHNLSALEAKVIIKNILPAGSGPELAENLSLLRGITVGTVLRAPLGEGGPR